MVGHVTMTTTLCNKPGYNVRQYLPDLYSGGYLSPAWPKVPMGEGGPPWADWQVILDLSAGSGIVSDAEVRKPYLNATRLVRFEIEDGAPIPFEVFDIAWALWKSRYIGVEKGRPAPMLIQCAAGLSRSPSVVCAILQRELDIYHKEASERVISIRDGVTFPLPLTLRSAKEWDERDRDSFR